MGAGALMTQATKPRVKVYLAHQGAPKRVVEGCLFPNPDPSPITHLEIEGFRNDVVARVLCRLCMRNHHRLESIGQHWNPRDLFTPTLYPSSGAIHQSREDDLVAPFVRTWDDPHIFRSQKAARHSDARQKPYSVVAYQRDVARFVDRWS